MINLVYGMKAPYEIFKNIEFLEKFNNNCQDIFTKHNILFTVWPTSDTFAIIGVLFNSQNKMLMIEAEKMNTFSEPREILEYFGIIMNDVIQQWYEYFNKKLEQLKEKNILEAKEILFDIALPEKLMAEWYIIETN